MSGESPISRRDLRLEPTGGLVAAICTALEAALDDGRIAAGGRLPAVRTLARTLQVSPATIAGAYEELGRRGRTRGHPGRGTFAAVPAAPQLPAGVPRPAGRPGSAATGAAAARPVAAAVPWRRRLQAQTTARLLAARPGAVDCASGAPDPDLLPLDVLRRAWRSALDATRSSQLQYASAEPDGELADAAGRRLALDGIEDGPRQLAVGSSALQLLELGLRAAARRAGWAAPVVAVEEPGYATVLDAVDRLGWSCIGVPVDIEGATAGGLAAALEAGARLVVLTPRAQNPVGASWTPARQSAVAEVLAAFPDAVALEDDHAADISLAPSLSLIRDPRLRSRVVHIRSFSKAIAPDLRVAVAVASPSLRSLMVEEKSYVDGWTSRLAQRALARALDDPALGPHLARAAAAYAERRAAAAAALAASDLGPAGGGAVPAADGTNVWIRLPVAVDEAAVLERAAAAGWVAGPGEVFHLRPGPSGAVRLTVSQLSSDDAAAAARAIAAAAADLAGAAPAACAAVT